MTTDTETPKPTDPATEPDPAANWDEKRRRYQAKLEAENRRGVELTKYRQPERPTVQGRHWMLKRARR
jgi:hypothetical protein